MRAKMAATPILGIIAGSLLTGAVITGIDAPGDEASAQDQFTWQVAGPPDGFKIEDMNAGLGPDQSLDEWIEELPVECDFQILERDALYRTVFYRCPEG